LFSSASNFTFYRRGCAIFAVAATLASPSHASRAQDNHKPGPDPHSILTFGEKLKVRGIPNAGKVSDTLYRGAQPTRPVISS